VINSDLATLVKQAVDIVDVIGQAVPLRRAGNRHVGLCPFHQEKTPSFHVDAQNQLYYCFGCGSGGDVLSFVMKYRNLSFGEAIKDLAERYHIPLPEADTHRYGSGTMAEAARKEREQIYRVLESAADYFYRLLHHSSEGKAAREYLLKRGLPSHVVETERLGYASAQWDGLLRSMESSSIDPELGIKAGLFGKGSRDRVYDRFRNRLIFPIRDEQGRIAGFGGRSLSGDVHEGPKYLNSPETPVYHKGRMLYQLPRAREACREVRQVVLVEGYMDLLAFHAKDFYRVVATLGTALTSQQVRLLMRMCDEVVLAYDADEAGERAMLRALPLFLQEQLAVSCIRFPDGMDPDDFLKREGMEAFEDLLQRREDLGMYSVRKRLESWDGSSVGKSKVLSDLRPVIEAVRQPVLKSEYVRMIASRLSLSEAVVERQFAHWDRRPRRTFQPHRPILAPRLPQAQSLEESVVRAMIKHPSLIEEVEASGVIVHFQQPQLKALAEALLEAPCASPEDFNASVVYAMLQDEGLKELFTGFLLEPGDLSEARIHLQDWLEALSKRKTKETRRSLQEALRRAEQEGDSIQVRHLLAQMQSLCGAKKRVKDSSDNV